MKRKTPLLHAGGEVPDADGTTTLLPFDCSQILINGFTVMERTQKALSSFQRKIGQAIITTHVRIGS
jgi:hypothetical protein